MVLVAALLTVGQTPAAIAHQRAFLEHRYETLNEAFKTLSLPAVKTWLYTNTAPGFFLHPMGGSDVSAAETIDQLKTQFLTFQSVSSSKLKLSNFSFHPDRMSCSVHSHLDAMTKGKQHLVGDSISVCVWKLIKGNWKLASMVTTDQHTTLNGKKVM